MMMLAGQSRTQSARGDINCCIFPFVGVLHYTLSVMLFNYMLRIVVENMFGRRLLEHIEATGSDISDEGRRGASLGAV